MEVVQTHLGDIEGHALEFPIVDVALGDEELEELGRLVHVAS
jgi:hypothetical protein